MAPSQTFHDHIKELRRRILWVVLSIGASAGIGYVLRVRIIQLLQHPLGFTLYYSSPAGSFNFVLKLSMMIGVFVALPVAIYHLLRFIEPALPINIKPSTMVKIIGTSFSLAVTGITFAYYFMIPMSLKFFAGYSTAQIQPLISASEYLSYIVGTLTIFALVFQIPLLILFINWIKPTKPRSLLRYQKHVIVGAFGIAIILPFTYDPLSQFIVAIPIIFLFYLSVVLLWFANRGKRYPEASSAPAPAPVKPLFPAIPATPVVSSPRRLMSLDGFVASQAQPKPSSRPTPSPAGASPAINMTVQPLPAQSALSGPHLSVDGIVRPFASST